MNEINVKTSETIGKFSAPNILVRRQFISAAGLAAVGLIVPLSDSEAATMLQKAAKLGISERYVQHFGSEVISYGNYIKKLRLKNISINQVIAPHAKNRGRVYNSLPPRHMWKKVKPTLKAIDRLVSETKVPLKDIVSAYRSPRYNAACPGAKRGSYHQKNVACDIVLHTSPWRVTKAARRLRSAGVFRGGIGSYRGFTHVDTRGVNVDW